MFSATTTKILTNVYVLERTESAQAKFADVLATLKKAISAVYHTYCIEKVILSKSSESISKKIIWDRY